jgi:acyl-CoA thioester hydrolase
MSFSSRVNEMHPLDFRLPYEIVVTASAEDIDQLGHVNNTVYLRWVQVAAIAHWSKIATPEQQAEMVWIVLRHEIDYKSAAKLDDEIILKTWIGLAEGLRFDRHTEVLSAERKVLAVAKTVWCPVDPVTQRPKKVSAEVRRMFSSGQ